MTTRRDFLKIGIGATLATATGCASRSRGPTRNFPSHYHGAFHHELNRARHIINDVGVHSVSPRPAIGQLRAGERKFGNQWCWHTFFPGWRQPLWVAGLCFGNRIEIGAHPQTFQEVDMNVVHHEFVHHWLMTNGHGPFHFPVYDSRVWQWAYARRVTGQTIDDTADNNPDIWIHQRHIVITRDRVAALHEEFEPGFVSVVYESDNGWIHYDGYIVNE